MCHPVFCLDLPHLPSLPVFLPHAWPPHLPPVQLPPNQPKQTQPVATLTTPMMILNLVIVVSLLLRKIKKSGFFWVQPFSNMVKIKLFLADTKSYVSLDLNKITRNTHLFKLTGELSLENVTLRKKWIWDALEIRWDDIHIILNEKEIHLPTMLIIPLIHKLKVRKLFGKRDLLHMYIMLKQRKILVQPRR